MAKINKTDVTLQEIALSEALVLVSKKERSTKNVNKIKKRLDDAIEANESQERIDRLTMLFNLHSNHRSYLDTIDINKTASDKFKKISDLKASHKTKGKK